jgi:hypothetical protein
MPHAATDPKRHAHELIDRMAPGQLSAVVGLMEILLDPVARSLANAPYDDEPISDEENRAVASSKEWLKHNDPIPHEEILAEFGLTQDDFDRMGRTPVEGVDANGADQ